MSWEYNRRVKYYETDRMGVVHHSNYLRLLEDARMDWLGDNICVCLRTPEWIGWAIISSLTVSLKDRES